MNLFKHLFQSARRSSPKAHKQANRRQVRPLLECLEARLVPANVLVVPISQATDGSHFHTLTAAIAAAGTEGVVTIEPGVSPDPIQTPVLVNQERITIQGDPNVPASILPTYQLSVQTDLVNLANLNISSLVVGVLSSGTQPGSSISVHNCLINTLTAFDVSSTYSQNIITGSASFDQGGVSGGDVISNNTFTSAAQTLLSLSRCSGATVSKNTFFADGGNAIFVLNSHTFNDGTIITPTTIANNNITCSQNADDIVVQQSGTAVSDVRILNNRLNAGGGLIMFMSIGDDAHFRALVQGNDFHNDAVGVGAIGDGTHCGTIDMGGGPLGSQGGNDFRGFALPTGLSKAAIEVSHAPLGIVVAEQNIFSAGVTPSDVTFAGEGGGSTDVLHPLSSQRASVQALYNEVLGRSGSLAELDFWVTVLNAKGQAVVVNDILRSSESFGVIVDSFYLRILGRQSDSDGRVFWINFLQHGGTEEQLENLFLTSPEYQGHINTDFVQSLYINILGRTGAANELAYWNSQLQQLGLGGLANGFIQSSEHRSDTVRALFQTFLHRLPTTAESNALVNSSTDLLSLEGTILSLPEYFTNG